MIKFKGNGLLEVIIILVFYANRAIGQPEPKLKFENPILKGCCPDAKNIMDSIITNAPIVFDGTVIKSDYTILSREGVEYTTFLVKIDRVYRGADKLSTGTVEVILPRGHNGVLSGYLKGSWNLLLCKQTVLPGRFDADNSVRLELFYNENKYPYLYQSKFSLSYYRLNKDLEWNKHFYYYQGFGGVLKIKTKRKLKKFLEEYGLKSTSPQKPAEAKKVSAPKVKSEKAKGYSIIIKTD